MSGPWGTWTQESIKNEEKNLCLDWSEFQDELCPQKIWRKSGTIRQEIKKYRGEGNAKKKKHAVHFLGNRQENDRILPTQEAHSPLISEICQNKLQITLNFDLKSNK